MKKKKKLQQSWKATDVSYAWNTQLLVRSLNIFCLLLWRLSLLFFGLHARSIIFNNDNNICIKKLAPRLFSLCLNGLCQFFRSIQSLVPKPLNVTWQNCANSTKVGSSLTFAGKIGKGLRLRLRSSEIGFVTFWALYWTCFFLSSKEDFQKKKLISCIV